MLKRIPKTVRYVGYLITVEQISQEVMNDLCDEPGTPGLWLARYEEEKFTVYLTKGRTDLEKWRTFWHEMDHAYTDISEHDKMQRGI